MIDHTVLIEHLKLIEGVVDRLARSSFAVKATASAVTAALVAVIVAQGEPTVGLGILSLFSLWGLDAYYLSRERAYRDLYDRVRTERPTDQADPAFLSLKYKVSKLEVVSAVRSATLVLYYPPLVTAVAIAAGVS
ncbi:MAG: hypothetical protein HQ478_06145 [Chloroflexi bacterium]|nr:hypothetical protein [Chloroflexota bacterium]